MSGSGSGSWFILQSRVCCLWSRSGRHTGDGMESSLSGPGVVELWGAGIGAGVCIHEFGSGMVSQ